MDTLNCASTNSWEMQRYPPFTIKTDPSSALFKSVLFLLCELHLSIYLRAFSPQNAYRLCQLQFLSLTTSKSFKGCRPWPCCKSHHWWLPCSHLFYIYFLLLEPLFGLHFCVFTHTLLQSFFFCIFIFGTQKGFFWSHFRLLSPGV